MVQKWFPHRQLGIYCGGRRLTVRNYFRPQTLSETSNEIRVTKVNKI